MALLDTASLIVTPNGYKASKLYSIVPSDGTGDMTFSRTGNTATRVNLSGLIETVNANIPRLDYLGSTCPKLLMEPQRTNLLTYSLSIGDSNTSKTNMTATSDSTALPDGNTSGYKLTGNSGTSTKFIGKTYTTSTIGTYTTSFFVKYVDEQYITLIILDNSGANNTRQRFDILNGSLNGSITNGGTAVGVNSKIEAYANGWYRISISGTFIGTITNIQSQIFLDNYATTTKTTSFLAYGAQLELGSFATSYIPTTTASVTRNLDGCSKTSATALIGQTEGAMVIDVDINSRISSTQFMLRNTAVTSYISFIITSSVIQCAIYNASTQTVTINFTNSSSGRFKLGVAYKLNDVAYYVNGSLIGTDTSTDIPAMTEIDLYFNASNFLKVNSFTHWKTRLTNSELAQLTTL